MTSLSTPLERHIHCSTQRSGFNPYFQGKENTLKNVSGLNDYQLLQQGEDKTGRPLVFFLLAGVTNRARDALIIQYIEPRWILRPDWQLWRKYSNA